MKITERYNLADSMYFATKSLQITVFSLLLNVHRPKHVKASCHTIVVFTLKTDTNPVCYLPWHV